MSVTSRSGTVTGPRGVARRRLRQAQQCRASAPPARVTAEVAFKPRLCHDSADAIR